MEIAFKVCVMRTLMNFTYNELGLDNFCVSIKSMKDFSRKNSGSGYKFSRSFGRVVEKAEIGGEIISDSSGPTINFIDDSKLVIEIK